MKDKQFKRGILVGLFLIVSFAGTALVQDPPVPAPPPPPGLPIDGGILAGIVVAIAYGAKKTLFNKEK
ncbi:hypothetical protein JJL45_02885 [Tamlana sp. s12]|uniref:hypothetical protein n=1 Tax=Tamlana sp. s12 TaxID=1630406 RepID=UPI00192C25CA|nr:hypothetical protein [Tamlana sp. s12]QQY82955.1 hypothetical protein JJL45_02885 [Tamlana sp. s12]